MHNFISLSLPIFFFDVKRPWGSSPQLLNFIKQKAKSAKGTKEQDTYIRGRKEGAKQGMKKTQQEKMTRHPAKNE